MYGVVTKKRVTPRDKWFAHAKKTTHAHPISGKQITVTRDSGGQFSTGSGSSTDKPSDDEVFGWARELVKLQNEWGKVEDKYPDVTDEEMKRQGELEDKMDALADKIYDATGEIPDQFIKKHELDLPQADPKKIKELMDSVFKKDEKKKATGSGKGSVSKQ